MEIKDILRERREELNITMKELSVKVGVSESTISRWESGDIANMRRDKIALLSEALQISPAVIMGWDEKAFNKQSSGITSDEIEFLSRYRKLDDDDRYYLDRVINGLLQDDKYKKDSNKAV